ncbi:MAG: alpha/beta hydrolase [Polyangiaceae bacterium]|nr:alpha/beta hydrolase [Polyangiaceae bacterium]
MPHVELNGQKIFYEDSGGDGPAIVFGHGFLMDHTMFDAQVRVLVPKYRVIRHDQRGFGQTQTDGKPFTYWDCADDAVRLCDHLGIERAVFGGMSQGGFVSLRVALRYPDRVRALVLISTQAGVDDAEKLAGYRQMLDSWRQFGLVVPLREAIATLILGGREHWEPWISKWATLPQEAMVDPTLCLLERDDITERVGTISAPAIVFHGTADLSIHIDRARMLYEKLGNAKRFVEVPGAAHAANVTHPEVVNGPLVEFLREYVASARAS